MNDVQPNGDTAFAQLAGSQACNRSTVIDRPEGKVIPAILCGGAGARLWPASRANRPKQFISLVGDCSTFQAALRRAAGSHLFGRPLVLASDEHRFVVAQQVADMSLGADVVLEPERRDSAAAVATAALYVARKNPATLVLTLAADHVIGDEASFRDYVDAAATVARRGYIVALGVVPTGPAVGFGYIRPGRAIDNTGAFAIDCFVEKPNAELAQDYLERGYLWNSGNFVFRADVMLGELERFAPRILAAARAALERAQCDRDFVRLDAEAFKTAPATSIDYAVMERTERAAVLEVRYPWSDIGSWGALWEATARDENGNAVRGNVEVLATRNSLVQSQHMLTAVVGVDDIVVVTEPDVVLVTSRARSMEVKDLVTSMRKKGRPEADTHTAIDRPQAVIGAPAPACAST